MCVRFVLGSEDVEMILNINVGVIQQPHGRFPFNYFEERVVEDIFVESDSLLIEGKFTGSFGR